MGMPAKSKRRLIPVGDSLVVTDWRHVDVVTPNLEPRDDTDG